MALNLPTPSRLHSYEFGDLQDERIPRERSPQTVDDLPDHVLGVLLPRDLGEVQLVMATLAGAILPIQDAVVYHAIQEKDDRGPGHGSPGIRRGLDVLIYEDTLDFSAADGLMGVPDRVQSRGLIGLQMCMQSFSLWGV